MKLKRQLTTSHLESLSQVFHSADSPARKKKNVFSVSLNAGSLKSKGILGSDFSRIEQLGLVEFEKGVVCRVI